jgi:hypothetical protein
MKAECSAFRGLIPHALMGDLDAEEQQSLNLHLAECAPCRDEHSQYVETLRQMRLAGDVPVPRHFFVYSGERSKSPWSVFRSMNLAWQGAIAAAALLLGVLAASAVFRLNVRAEAGTWVLSIGEGAPAQIIPLPAQVVDSAAIEARVLSIVEDRNRREKLDWIRMIRAEIAKSNRSMSEDQRRLLQAALSDVEARLGGEISAAARSLEDRSDRALTTLYQVISSEHERDLVSVNTRLNSLAVNGERRNNQTEAILDTLLQVADLKLK